MEALSVAVTLTAVAGIIKAVNDVIEECDRYYGNVNKELEKINEISGGQFTANLIETGSKLKQHYKDLIGGMKKLLATLHSIHDENKKADETAASSLKSANSKY